MQRQLNEPGDVRPRRSMALIVERHAENRTTGSFIVIDQVISDTVGAGIVLVARGDWRPGRLSST
jgi:sulfate adenylyltransferase subunit 1 (EFTu-like GTPase family)